MTSPIMLAALRWDPNIRGGLIVLTGFSILVGSVYLLLATNTGPRLGFVLAAAGLFGWMTVMGVVWTVFGIGIKGEEPSWKPLEVVSGDLSQSTISVAQRFPAGWKPLPKSDPSLSDAEAAADSLLAGEGGGSGGGAGEGGGGETKLRVEPPFDKKADYEMGEAFKKGGENWFLLGLRHKPHYAAIQVKPSASAPPDVKAMPVTTVILLRDLGNLRAPAFFFTVFVACLFAVCCVSLHYREREAAARQASVP